MSLSLESLQELLSQDAERREQRQKERDEHRAKYAPLQAIDQVWQAHGVTSPISGVWKRPIPNNLYQCPLSPPQTTLVPWKSLPRNVQTKLTPPSDLEAGVVEVPLAYLNPEENEQDAQDSAVAANNNISTVLQRRPLHGNLSDKLSEYTRGMSGQARPFRPGGLGTAQNDGADEDIYRSPAATQRAREVLDNGSRASWKDGTLLTAPPGVDFEVGLSWKDVYGSDEEIEQDETMEDGHPASVTPEKEVPSMMSEDISRLDTTISTRLAPASNLFSRSFFDDDSLFGSSSSSSSDESDEEEGTVKEESDKEEEEAEPEPAGAEMKVTSPAKETEELSIDASNVDALLDELTITENARKTKEKKAVADISTNPLVLAERQARLQNDTTRKSWASTKLLPIADFDSLIPNPAMKFPFTLDDFQQQAVARLERSESVFVAAHTSAGKTVVAEYAVALAKQRATRCIYTSPIKALSNQKFRDFSVKFGAENVGLITGDLQVNADDSTCLIMTTEILRSMLYRGADLIRDIEWVVFDEVHYVNDTERGVVWEEVIIMLPNYVNLIFLSATTPNTLEFSDWIGRTKRKVVHVIRTDYRPVPLSHFLWAGLKLHKVREGNGGFLEKGYSEAANALLPASAKDPNKKKGEAKGRQTTGSKQLAWQAQGSKQNWMSLVRFLDRELLTPTVVFSFSKRKCEEIANQLRSLDLNTAKERSAVQAFTISTVARLSENDHDLPQVQTVCEMVQRGIGIHHGGLLPILKEMVEILFSRNLIKVLFATETFAMGVNMPARAVVFNSIRKHDGTQFRVLEPGEYTQMAGRAGRRGLDKVGTVIMCCFGETPPPVPILRHMLTGKSTLLRSQFRLTYNMILNLLRVEEMSVEAMIKRSFSEFSTQRALTANEYPQLLARGVRTLARLDEQFKNDAEGRIGVDDIEDYFSICTQLLSFNENVLSHIHEMDSASFEKIMQPGRIIIVTAARQHGVVRAPALILQFPSQTRGSQTSGSSIGLLTSSKSDNPTGNTMICLVLLPESYVDDEVQSNERKPGTVGYVGRTVGRNFTIQEIQKSQVLLVSEVKHKIDPKALLKEDVSSSRLPSFQANSLGRRDDPNIFFGVKAKGGKKGMSELSSKSSGAKDEEVLADAIGYLVDAERLEVQGEGVAVMDLRDYLKRGSDVMHFRQTCQLLDEDTQRMRSSPSHHHPSLEKVYKTVERKESLRTKVQTLQHLLSNESLSLFPDFLQRKAVLRKLGYVDENEAVAVKGRVACEVNTCDELIITEMVFEGVLNDLTPEESVAVLSALIFQEKSSDEELDSELPERLVTCCEQMRTIAYNLGVLQKEQGLEIDPGEYCDGSMKFGLVHVVYEWAMGVQFKNICELTDVQEGSIVRCITRLDELCREVRNCARVVGNPSLYRKMESASTAIKRDIVFASSLYVS